MVIYLSENVGILNLCINFILLSYTLFWVLTSYTVVTPFTICQHAHQLVSLFCHRYGSFEDCEGERNQCQTGESRGAVRT